MTVPKTLAIDFGTERIGLAISYATLAEPLLILPHNEFALEKIAELCAEHEVEQVLLGVSENEMAVTTMAFKNKLEQLLVIPIVLTDETLSSQQARAHLRHLTHAKRSRRVDHYAATEFLQEWLDSYAIRSTQSEQSQFVMAEEMPLLKTFSDGLVTSSATKRYAVRAVLFDGQQRVPILAVTKHDYYKLPGGEIETGESQMMALHREIREEVGSAVEIKKVLGKIVEFRAQHNFWQTSYCYLGSIITKGPNHLEEGEKADGFELLWVDLAEALALVSTAKTTDYEGLFIKQRDTLFLETAALLGQ